MLEVSCEKKRTVENLSCPVLVMADDPAKKIDVNADKFTIGRSQLASLPITHVYVSREHCFFQRENETWILHDLSSFGTFVNGKMLGKNNSVKLNDGDLINLGRVKKFTYWFYISDTSFEEAHKSKKRKNLEEKGIEKNSDDNPQEVANEVYLMNPPKVANEVHLSDELRVADLAASVRKKAAERRHMKSQQLLLKNQCKGRLKDLDLKISKERERLKVSLENDETLKSLYSKRERIENETKNKILKLELKISKSKERETELLLKNKQLNELMEKERKLFEQRLLEEKESLLSELEKQRHQNQKEEEKNLEVEKNIKELEMRLQETEQKLKTKEEAISEMSKEMIEKQEKFKTDLGELVETELQCSICSEILFSPTTLNCKHTFCRYCITKWKERKPECPMCRTRITTETQAVVIDSFVNKIVDNLPDDIKQRRQEIIEERKVQELLSNPPPSTSNAVQPNVANNPVTRGGQPAANARVETVSVSSDSDDNSEYDSLDEESDSSSVEGDENAYYGGYGYCYRCGRRGHWVRGCPY